MAQTFGTILISLWFFTFSIVFPNTELLICLKDSFSKIFMAFVLSSVFISSYGFNHAFWFNSSTFPVNIRLDEDVLKTPWIRLSFLSSEDVFKTSSRRLRQDEYVLFSLPSSEDVFKRSSRHLGQDQHICLDYTSSRRLQDVFKTSSRRFQDVFKTSSRRLGRRKIVTLKTCWKRLQDMPSRRLQDVLKTNKCLLGCVLCLLLSQDLVPAPGLDVHDTAHLFL